MNRVANTYLDNGHLMSQRVSVRTLTAPPQIPQISRALIGTVAELHRWSGAIPSSVVLGMILLATLAVCATVTMRTRAERQNSSDQHERMSAEIDALRKTNATLRTEVVNLQSDPVTIESAARSRLSMVRPNEIVVAIETRSPVIKQESQSFVR